MPIVRPYNDEVRGEQAAGGKNRSTSKTLYCFDPKNPLTLYEFGGHGIPDAPEYTISEPQPHMTRHSVGGYNQTEYEHVDSEYIQSEDLTMQLPERFKTLAELIVAVQRRTGRNFVFFLTTNDDCPDKCDYHAELRGDSARMGEIQETNTVLAYDTEGDGGAVTKTVMLRCQGATRNYDGIRIQANSVSGLDAVYAIVIGKLDDCSDDSFCPYQVGYAFDSDGVAVPAGVRYADKWGVSSAAIAGTALGAGNIITSAVWWNGDIYVGYADAYHATATAGGIAKSASGTGALADVGVTSSGIQTLVVAGSRLHAFGEGGEWHYTIDGENWTPVTSTVLGSTDLYCSAYNPYTKRIYLGGVGGAAFVIDGFTVNSISGVGSADLHSVAVAGRDHVAYGANDSKIYENFEESNGGSFSNTKTFPTGAVNVLLAEKRSTNLVAAVGSIVYQRSIAQRQGWHAIGASPDASVILSGDIGYEEHRRGSEYFVFGTTDGAIFEAQTCTPCRSA